MEGTVLSNASILRTAALRGPVGHVIAGEVESDPGSRRHPVIDPCTGERIVDAPLGTAIEVDRAVRAARTALPAWRRSTPADRAHLLFELAALIEQHAVELAALDALNVGKPDGMAEAEMAMCGDVLRFMAGAARSAHAPATGTYAPGHRSMILREPLGVVAAITPWNYPLLTAMFKIAAALAAGNAIVLKPSELTPLSTARFAALAASVLPVGVLNVVLGTGPEVGAALADHDGVDAISLTGSVASGVSVALAGSRTLKRVHLELGGKAPVVVFADADVERAVEAIVQAGLWNTGQECGAAARVICAREVEAEVVDRVAAAARSVVLGRSAPAGRFAMGPLISASHRERVDGIVQGAIASGATAVVGGAAAADRPGFFYEPTLLTGLRAGSDALVEEIFGPVMTVEAFADEDEAIRLANDSRYGLAASVWTESARRAMRMTDALDYGTVWVNAHLAIAVEMPWVGFGMSGTGREMSTYGIDDYTRTKHVMIATSP